MCNLCEQRTRVWVFEQKNKRESMKLAVYCMSNPKGCLSRTNFNVSPKHIEILLNLLSQLQNVILCHKCSLCSHWPCAFTCLDRRLHNLQSILAHNEGLPSSSGLCLHTTSFPGRFASWVSTDYIWTGEQPWCLMSQQFWTSCYPGTGPGWSTAQLPLGSCSPWRSSCGGG